MKSRHDTIFKFIVIHLMNQNLIEWFQTSYYACLRRPSLSYRQIVVNSENDNVPSFIVEDVIGKEPTRANIPLLDEALRELDQQVGLESVKKVLHDLIAMAKSNYHAELRGEHKNLSQVVLNRMFLGNPGVGKTTVAKIYAKVLKALRLLSKGEIMYKTASDFMGSHVGESQKKTQAILELAEGKVLIIDEAYVLDDNLYANRCWIR